jgi:hypothetical protein
MNSEKYIGLDVHQATIVVAVTDSTGKLVMESILETEAATILQFFAGLRGNLAVTCLFWTYTEVPFPLPKLLGFVGTTDLSATPPGPACLSRVAS